MLICLYELNSLENAISFIDTYKHFIKNSKLIKEHIRDKYMNFLNFVNDLIKLRNKPDEFNLVRLREKVLKTKELFFKDWIIEKLDEL